ncbi:hypothetical protein [Sphingobium lignivorans]|uniref:Uncharacterized protein n=1 Tax=Sphingobium lignivorans TaxID=2735886 RepID=A0ABR6NK01_9SPHN|nr:hypothetical protein [Sphingobium lignivorans]MBB5987441.1 hypothetical protein [Sphingobium lignivorans]
MIGIYDLATGVLECVVTSTDGYDLTGKGTAEAPEDYDGAACNYLFEGGAFIPNLSLLTQRLLAKIDQEAGAVRERFITVIPGQETTYKEKEGQARAWLTAADPDPEDPAYGMLAREAEECGISISEVAASSVAMADYWRPINERIEARRRGRKEAVKAATTVAAKEAAAIVDWESILP